MPAVVRECPCISGAANWGNVMKTNKMAQWVKALVTKPDNPSSIPGPHMVGREPTAMHTFIILVYVCIFGCVEVRGQLGSQFFCWFKDCVASIVTPLASTNLIPYKLYNQLHNLPHQLLSFTEATYTNSAFGEKSASE